jgi:hypothetical protein
VNDTTQWTDKTWVMRGWTDLLTGEMSNNRLYLYRYSTGYNLNRPAQDNSKPATEGGLYYGRVGELICFTDSGINYQFYFLNGFWHLHKMIRSAAVTMFITTVNVRCWCYPNVFAQLYKSFGGGAYAAVGSPVLGSQMQNVGVDATGCAAGNNSFKVLLYDNNCNYGYSNVVVVAV